jgi:hypothetical protein
MDLLHSSGDVVELLQEPLDAGSDRLTVLLKGFDLGGRILILLGQLLDLELEGCDALFRGGPRGSLSLKQLNRA